MIFTNGNTMKRTGMMLLAAGLLAGQAGAGEMPALKTDKDKLSYAIGVSTGRNFKKAETDVDLEFLLKGIKAGLAGDKLLLTEKELRMIMNNYQSEVRRNMLSARQQALESNRKKGEEFLTQNKTKPGVVTLPDGVQYLVVKPGSGRKPIDSDIVEVRYRGTLLDGTEFDATEGERTAKIKISALIPGWSQALKLMPVGSTWRIYVPSRLAYGERGVGVDIGPNETLVYETELVAIESESK